MKRMMALSEIMEQLYARRDQSHLTGMSYFGINAEHALGISVNTLRQMARGLGEKNHALALELWQTGIHEARILATMVDDPTTVSEEQMEQWAAQFDSWDLCDQCCGNLFDKTALAWKKAAEWCAREAEYEKRAGFVLMASLAVHDKHASDERYLPFLAIIQREAYDHRNFVKKAVNWALRQIGKRNRTLNQAAIATAQEILQKGKGNWVASNALRELSSQSVQSKLQK